MDNVEEYQKVVDAEWNILYDKLERIQKSGATVVLSKLPIGDVATQVSSHSLSIKQPILTTSSRLLFDLMPSFILELVFLWNICWVSEKLNFQLYNFFTIFFNF